MNQETKTKNCRRKECKKPFVPNTEWQKYCSSKCRDIISNRKRAKKIREMTKFYEENAQGAA